MIKYVPVEITGEAGKTAKYNINRRKVAESTLVWMSRVRRCFRSALAKRPGP